MKTEDEERDKVSVNSHLFKVRTWANTLFASKEKPEKQFIIRVKK